MGTKILLVNDDELLLGALECFLTIEQFQTRTVAKAELVETEVTDFRPNLIVMDIRLDTCDGRVICDKLKSQAGTSHIPIVLLTGLSYDEIAFLDSRADAVIGKPYCNDSLLHIINQCLKID